eukprot:9487835-Pyramimonas_sp.AAC.1
MRAEENTLDLSGPSLPVSTLPFSLFRRLWVPLRPLGCFGAQVREEEGGGGVVNARSSKRSCAKNLARTTSATYMGDKGARLRRWTRKECTMEGEEKGRMGTRKNGKDVEGSIGR